MCGSNNCAKKSGQEWDSGDDCCYNPSKLYIILDVHKTWFSSMTNNIYQFNIIISSFNFRMMHRMKHRDDGLRIYSLMDNSILYTDVHRYIEYLKISQINLRNFTAFICVRPLKFSNKV